MKHRRLIFLIIALLLAISLPAQSDRQPRNIILMIGDGMGFAQVTLARLSLADTSPALSMDSLPFAGILKTHSADSLITDSAAAGTALATGCKTNNGMISMLPDGTPVRTVLEAARDRGKAVGLVTNTTVTHATPAAFGAHVAKRGDEADIAPQYLEARIDFIAGGGRHVFIPQSAEGSKRKDDRDLLLQAAEAGYTVVDNREDFLAIRGGRVLGLFAMGPLSTDPPEPSLAEMTEKAVEILSRDKDGFFLMVEGGQIDWRCHDNDTRGTVKQVFDFDAAVGKALDFARRRGDTLVIVTADHETGGLSIIYPEPGSGARFRAHWATTGHSGCNVPLLAEGPGAERFTGVLDNTDVPKKIALLWKLDLKNFRK